MCNTESSLVWYNMKSQAQYDSGKYTLHVVEMLPCLYFDPSSCQSAGSGLLSVGGPSDVAVPELYNTAKHSRISCKSGAKLHHRR